MHDVWPPMNATLDSKSPYSHQFRGNNGAGVMIDPAIGYFSTWQFAFYQLTMARLRASKYRTLDPSKATAFIIPFDLGAHSFIDHNNGRTRVASPHGWRALEHLKEASKNPIFWKHRGHDHFVLFSITSYQIIGIGAKCFMTQICENCTVLTIETTPTNTCRKYYSNKSKKYWYGIPYPSSFHYWEGIQQLPWKQSRTIARPYLSIFIGSLETSTPKSNILRRLLHASCTKDTVNSTSTSSSPRDYRDLSTRRCLWFDTAHSCSGVLNQTDGMLLYRQAIFCLAPPGDSLTRKSLFDSLVSGCIPVVFVRATITQYLWHIPAEIVDEISIYIPGKYILTEKQNFLDYLRSIPAEKILQMQRRIEEVAPTLQFSVVPDGFAASEDEANRFYRLSQLGYQNIISAQSNSAKQRAQAFLGIQTDASAGHAMRVPFKGKVWEPPFADAVDVIIKRLLDRKTIEPIDGFSEEQLVKFAQLRDEMQQSHPDYLISHENSSFVEERQGFLGAINNLLHPKPKRRPKRRADYP